jgi:Leucine-rich repeat (LRR) protein
MLRAVLGFRCRRLDLSGNTLRVQGTVPAFVTALTNLQDLSLANNGLTATIPATLSNLKKLTNLDLR